ncbi:hypothetical protein [Streptomyces sp. NPDC096142]|uniref:hypothetical protein n=1 Tax=Streptomyces sp. NPDC096142 TaxID=3366077 RepID=UPI0037F2BF03
MNGTTATPVIDTHVILGDGDKILFSQHGGPYSYGRRHMPSRKIDRGEASSEDAARQLFEENDITVVIDGGVIVARCDSFPDR